MSEHPTTTAQEDEAVTPGAKRAGWAITIALLLLFAGIAYLGLGATERITVPDLAGMTQTEATAKVATMGLVAQTRPAENPGDAAPGTVVSQEPEPGVGLRPGAAVTLEVVPAAQ